MKHGIYILYIYILLHCITMSLYVAYYIYLPYYIFYILIIILYYTILYYTPVLTRYNQELRHRKNEYTNKIKTKNTKNKHILYTEHIEYEDIQLQQAIELSLIEELRYNNPPPAVVYNTTSNSKHSSILNVRGVEDGCILEEEPTVADVNIQGKDRPVPPPPAGTGGKTATTVWGSDTPQSFKNATKVRRYTFIHTLLGIYTMRCIIINATNIYTHMLYILISLHTCIDDGLLPDLVLLAYHTVTRPHRNQ